MPAGSKPGERRGGRAKGAPNVLPDLRAITLKALMKAGGTDYLVRQANENPMGFLSLLGRVMPREVNMEVSGELKVRQEVRRDLVEKVIVLMRAAPEAQNEALEATATPLPAITHNPDTMLKAQRSQDRDSLSRRGENARKESEGTVSGVVQRAANMHLDRPKAPKGYQEEAIARIDGIRSSASDGASGRDGGDGADGASAKGGGGGAEAHSIHVLAHGRTA